MIVVPDDWEDLLARLGDAPWRMTQVLGTSDAGKTTFCRLLGRRLARSRRASAVDCDPGQSAIGPPTTVAFGWEPWVEGSAPAAVRFVGSKSPAGHFLQTLTGIRRLVDRALAEGAERLVLDASGYDGTGAGREFQFQAIDLLAPDHLVALQRGAELEPLLACFARRERPVIHRLAAPPTIEPRSRDARIAYRRERLASYFLDAIPSTLELTGLGLHGMVPVDPEGWQEKLVALCDREGFVDVLAIAERIEEDRLCLLAPPFDSARVASVQVGSLRIDPQGREL